jgi:hypothetical protein
LVGPDNPTPHSRTLPAGATDSDILPELAPHPGDVVVVKSRHSGFFDTNLHSILQELGVSTLVFTGGIGENAASIRARVCRDARWLGLDLDEEANESGGTCISRAGSTVTAWVIPTNEELMIARHVRRMLGPDGREPQVS